jgi:hypothetical protein
MHVSFLNRDVRESPTERPAPGVVWCYSQPTSAMLSRVFAMLFLATGLLGVTSAPPAAPPNVRIDQRQRFLLFDVIFHEQVNKQRRALMFFLDLAMRLKRTLVLPRTRLLRRLPGPRSQFAPEAEYVGWGELFNVSELVRLHPVYEIDQYLELHGRAVSLHVQLGHKDCHGSDEPSPVAFNGLSGALQVARSVCAKGLQYDHAKLQSREYADAESIAFSDSMDQLDITRALALRPYVRFEHGIYDAAAAFAQRTFGGAPFLAIHWRRTDFLAVRRTQPGVLQSASDVIRYAEAVMQEHGIAHVYLATDSDDEQELKQINQALQPARYGPSSAPQGRQASRMRQRTEIANVEIALCAMADRFLGTRTSSFTLAIMEERGAIFGKPAQSAMEMGVQGAGAAGAGAAARTSTLPRAGGADLPAARGSAAIPADTSRGKASRKDEL